MTDADRVREHPAERHLRRLSTPRAAAVAGVLFALLFGTVLVLLRVSLPDAGERGSQWVTDDGGLLRVAVILMPFAGITFLWFIGVVRDGFGKLEDKFFSSVFVGSGLLFLAMMFAAASVGAALVAGRRSVPDSRSEDVAAFGQHLMTTLSNTYALRMAAVFMISLATIWLRTRLMPTWLVATTYAAALTLLVASDVNLWMTLVFPVWVLVVSMLILSRAGVIDLRRD
ncbi:hypothetical protein ACFQWH_11120 [Mycolicibacterium sp. GCM10028919]|uniref:hypothetical protein n=1 Tax=Mycolicibacterium sp. GCM10028919 TaxID=3273401 RepID=UPI00360B008E